MRIINFILASEVSAKKILRQLEERSEAVEPLERLELTDSHLELGEAVEPLERVNGPRIVTAALDHNRRGK
jgi:hypothetical protein